jgi:hypothetical protein
MTIQGIATVVTVALALGYLVHKLFIASRPPRHRPGPDVPLSRLRKRKKRASGCH